MNEAKQVAREIVEFYYFGGIDDLDAMEIWTKRIQAALDAARLDEARWWMDRDGHEISRCEIMSCSKCDRIAKLEAKCGGKVG
jgi:hypothetical protein